MAKVWAGWSAYEKDPIDRDRRTTRSKMNRQNPWEGKRDWNWEKKRNTSLAIERVADSVGSRFLVDVSVFSVK